LVAGDGGLEAGSLGFVALLLGVDEFERLVAACPSPEDSGTGDGGWDGGAGSSAALLLGLAGESASCVFGFDGLNQFCVVAPTTTTTVVAAAKAATMMTISAFVPIMILVTNVRCDGGVTRPWCAQQIVIGHIAGATKALVQEFTRDVTINDS
jgi:hypothetical protein